MASLLVRFFYCIPCMEPFQPPSSQCHNILTSCLSIVGKDIYVRGVLACKWATRTLARCPSRPSPFVLWIFLNLLFNINPEILQEQVRIEKKRECRSFQSWRVAGEHRSWRAVRMAGKCRLGRKDAWLRNARARARSILYHHLNTKSGSCMLYALWMVHGRIVC